MAFHAPPLSHPDSESMPAVHANSGRIGDRGHVKRADPEFTRSQGLKAALYKHVGRVLLQLFVHAFTLD
jgi:hypothetical protein